MAKRSRFQELPDEIVYEFLINLPVKLLHRLRCVCRQWNCLISQPTFQEDHYNRRTQQRNLLLLTKPYPDLGRLRLSTYKYDGTLLNTFSCTVHNSIDLFDFELMQSCHGIVCLAPFDFEQIHLCNPSTNELIELPILNTQDFKECLCVGLVYASIKKIKVIRFVLRYVDDDYRCFGEVFTLGSSDRWRNIDPPPHRPCWAAPLLHRALHLMPCDGLAADDRYIAALDVDTEEYRRIPLPEVYFRKEGFFLGDIDSVRLAELRGFLCLTFNFWDTEKMMELWFWEDYVRGKWVKKYNIDLSPVVSSNLAFPVAIMDDGRILLNFKLGSELLLKKLFFYNPEDNCFSRMKGTNCSATLYVESFFGLRKPGFNELETFSLRKPGFNEPNDTVPPLGYPSLHQRSGLNAAMPPPEHPNFPGVPDGQDRSQDGSN